MLTGEGAASLFSSSLSLSFVFQLHRLIKVFLPPFPLDSWLSTQEFFLWGLMERLLIYLDVFFSLEPSVITSFYFLNVYVNCVSISVNE